MVNRVIVSGVVIGMPIVLSGAYYLIKRIFKKWDRCKEIAEVYFINEEANICSRPFDDDIEAIYGCYCKHASCTMRTIGRIISLIDDAKYHIDLAMYTFSMHSISEAIERAAMRGVKVRIITDAEMLHATKSRVFELHSLGIEVRVGPSLSLMHHKFCVIDEVNRSRAACPKKSITRWTNASDGRLVTGSTNWTNNGFFSNWENILIVNNPKVVSAYATEFERMWHNFNKMKK